MSEERITMATDAATDVATRIHEMLCTDSHHKLCYEAWEVVELLSEPQAPLVLERPRTSQNEEVRSTDE